MGSAHHTIWIVIGEGGKYINHPMWVVCWRHTEDDAKAIVEVMQREAEEFERWRMSDEGQYGAPYDARLACLADPYYRGSSYDGAKYHCEPVADDARALFDELMARQNGGAA